MCCEAVETQVGYFGEDDDFKSKQTQPWNVAKNFHPQNCLKITCYYMTAQSFLPPQGTQSSQKTKGTFPWQRANAQSPKMTASVVSPSPQGTWSGCCSPRGEGIPSSSSVAGELSVLPPALAARGPSNLGEIHVLRCLVSPLWLTQAIREQPACWCITNDLLV